jgi:tetratricopeptide (TPR) repeat protein
VCRRLDGIPLAIELAASRVEVLSPPELAARLDDRFRLLTGGSRTGLERHQTLRAAVDWSYDALAPTERAVLERLSVFAGGCTLDAAESVCAGDDVESEAVFDALSRLVAKSLVAIDRQPAGARYRMLETIRQYAREKLSPEASEDLRARHLGWCLAFTDRAGRGVWGADQMAWFDALEQEEDNLRQALEWTVGSADAEHALMLVGALGRFWMVRRRIDEGLRWTFDAHALEGSSDFPYLRAQALISAALGLTGYFGDYARARELAAESLELFRQVGVRRGLFWSLHTLSVSALFQGDMEQAVEFGDEAVDIARDSGNPGSLAYALLNRADVAIAEGTFEHVADLVAEAAPLVRLLDDASGIVRLLGIQGYLAIRSGQYADAIPYLEETVDRSRQSGDEATVWWAKTNLGCIALFTGDLVGARAHLEPLSSPSREVYSAFLDLLVLQGLGELSIAEGRLVEAAATYTDAMHRLVLDPTGLTAPMPWNPLVTQGFAHVPMPMTVDDRLVVEGASPTTWTPLRFAHLAQIAQTRQGPNFGLVSISRELGAAEQPVGPASPSSRVVARAPTTTEVQFAVNLAIGERLAHPGTGTGSAGTGTAPASLAVHAGGAALLPGMLAGAAKVASVVGASEPAARLFGAAEATLAAAPMLHRQGRWMLYEHLYDDTRGRARQALGDAAFDTAFAEGRSLTREEAVHLALATLAAVAE